MKKVIIFLVSFTLIACGSASKIKRVKKLVGELVTSGIPADTLLKVKRYDSLTSRPLNASFDMAVQVNPSFVTGPCAALAKATTEPARQRAVQQIQQAVCPEIHKDSTYHIELKAQGNVWQIPIRVKVDAAGGKSSFKVEGGALKAVVLREDTKVTFSAGYTGWGVIWRCFLVGAVCLAAGWVLRSVLR